MEFFRRHSPNHWTFGYRICQLQILQSQERRKPRWDQLQQILRSKNKTEMKFCQIEEREQNLKTFHSLIIRCKVKTFQAILL